MRILGCGVGVDGWASGGGGEKWMGRWRVWCDDVVHLISGW